MKFMKYIVLLNILVSTISIHAGRGAGGLKFPKGRVHRYAVNSERQARLAMIKSKLAAYHAQNDTINREIEIFYKQADATAAEILATIDPSTLENIDLEGLD